VVQGDVVRLFVAIPVAVLALCSATIGLALVVSYPSWASRRDFDVPPRSGMDILNAHSCGRGETKSILVRGVEDGYSPNGDEPGFIRPGRNNAASLPRDGTGVYDQVNVDRGLTDSFKLAGPYASGIFVFRARSLSGGYDAQNGSNNDGLGFGNLVLMDGAVTSGPIGGQTMSLARSGTVWSGDDDIYHASIDDIPLRQHPSQQTSEDAAAQRPLYSMRSYLNDEANPGWLDVFMQDDTAVDFIGLALCSAPRIRRGMTLTPQRLPGPEGRSLVHLACHNVQDTSRRCEPYVGDTRCTSERPVACLRASELPTPTDGTGRPYSVTWSGGHLAATEPVAGNRFRTVRDVEDFCASRFGTGWRVAAVHDGFRYQSVSGYGDPGRFSGRVWVDIADQPHATCWARE